MPAKPKPTSRRTSSRLSVDNWIDAGVELITDGGLGAVKIDALAKRLGVTKGSFYWHFTDASAFLDAVAERWCQNRGELKVKLDELGSAEPIERLEFLATRPSDPSYWRLEHASREWARTNKKVRATIELSDKWIVRFARQAFIDLGKPDVDATVCANAMFLSGLGWIMTRRDDPLVDLHHAKLLMRMLVGEDLYDELTR